MKKLKKIINENAMKGEIPAIFSSNIAVIQITDTKEVTIQNHNGIKHYSEDEIHIDCKNFQLKIKGENLGISNLVSFSVIITGEIEAVELIK